ncbi:MAG: hypothetical protein R3D90_15325 [Paracoccaceae bacterium]
MIRIEGACPDHLRDRRRCFSTGRPSATSWSRVLDPEAACPRLLRPGDAPIVHNGL